MALLGALSAFGPLSMDLYLPALPSLEAEFGAGQGAVQLTLTSVAVGLAVGQLVAGPLSDRFGRKVPVLVGVGALRAGLGAVRAGTLGVAAGGDPAAAGDGRCGRHRAGPRRRTGPDGGHRGRPRLRVAGLHRRGRAGPAPVLGGQLLRVTDWRGVFVVLAVIGLVLLVAARWLPETLPPERRSAAGPRHRPGHPRAGRPPGLPHRRARPGPGLRGRCSPTSPRSSFVLQTGFGLTPVQFSLVFAVNGAGIVAAGQLSRVLVPGSARAPCCAPACRPVAGGTGLVVTALAGGGLPVAAAGALRRRRRHRLCCPTPRRWPWPTRPAHRLGASAPSLAARPLPGTPRAAPMRR